MYIPPSDPMVDRLTPSSSQSVHHELHVLKCTRPRTADFGTHAHVRRANFSVAIARELGIDFPLTGTFDKRVEISAPLRISIRIAKRRSCKLPSDAMTAPENECVVVPARATI